jgi:hypothetical protein
LKIIPLSVGGACSLGLRRSAHGYELRAVRAKEAALPVKNIALARGDGADRIRTEEWISFGS